VSVAGPNGVGVWVLLVPGPGVFVLGLRFASGPKTVGFRDMTQQKEACQQTPLAWLGNQLAGMAPAPRHDNPSAKCLQPRVQPLPPAALELLWLGMDCPCARCLCLGLQHTMPPQIV
jgi:hypothetical protein